MKRGQLTIFIVIGLVLLIAVGIVFEVRSAYRDGNDGDFLQDINSEQAITQVYVKSCLDYATINALRQFGYEGIENPVWYETRGGMKIAYGQKWNFNLVPDYNIVLQSLSDRILHNVETCIGTKSTEEPRLELVSGDEHMSVSLYYPMTITRGQSVSKLSQFYTEIPISWSTMMLLASDLVDNMLTSDQAFDLSGLDYSCQKMRVCHSDGIIKMFNYRRIGHEPLFMYRFATDDAVIDSCSNYGGSC